MLLVFVVLLLTSAATCFDGTYPLSLPLYNGAMMLNCSLNSYPSLHSCLNVPGATDTHRECCADRDCCTDDKLLNLVLSELCYRQVVPGVDDREMAVIQHEMNTRVAACGFNGFKLDTVQLSLTPNATVFLDGLNHEDEQLRRDQSIVFVLQIIGGHVGLPILLLFSVFSKKLQRNILFINFCIVWIFYSSVSSIGLYRRGPASYLLLNQTLPFIRSDQECWIQAALIAGTQVMTDTSMCVWIIQLWIDFRATIYGPRGPGQTQLIKAMLFMAPYVTLLAFSLPALQVTAQSGIRNDFYCGLQQTNAYLFSLYGAKLVILLVTFVFDVYIIKFLYRRQQVLRKNQQKGAITLTLILRVVIFSLYRLQVAMMYAVVLLQWSYKFRGTLGNSGTAIPTWVNMLQAATPLVAFLVFITDKKYLYLLIFWRKAVPNVQTSSSNATSEVSAGSALSYTPEQSYVSPETAL